MITIQEFEDKFSRHIGRILTKLEGEDEHITKDAHAFVKGEMWLMCRDLIVMLEMKEGDNHEESRT